MSSFEIFCTICKLNRPTLTVYPGTKVVRAKCNTPGCGNEDNLNHAEPADVFVMPFGKYKGETIAEIVASDPNYAEWAADNIENEKIRARFQEALR